MSTFYKKLISAIIILAVFLFGNMAIVHAVSESIHAKIISHVHDGITESHIVETPDDTEPPHCTQTKVEINTIQQVRDTIDIPDVFKGSIPFYNEYDDKVYPLTQDTYFQYYP